LRIVTLGIDAPGAGKALRGNRLAKNIAKTRQAQPTAEASPTMIDGQYKSMSRPGD
jgi:glutamate synthase domain-containing protein 2